MSRSEARRRAIEFATSEIDDMPLKLVYEEEKPYGWLFVFNSVRFEETGDMDDLLVGLGPLLILAASGEIHELRTGPSVDEEIERIEALHKLR